MHPEEEEEEEEEQALAHTLEPLVRGLLRTGRLAAVLRAHAEQLAAEIKDAVKHTLSRTLPTLGDSGGGGGLAGTLGALSNDAMLQLLQAVWAAVSQCLGKAQAIRATVERAVLEASGARMSASGSTPKEGGEPSPRPLSPSMTDASAANSAPVSSSFSAMLLGLDPKAVKVCCVCVCCARVALQPPSATPVGVIRSGFSSIRSSRSHKLRVPWNHRSLSAPTMQRWQRRWRRRTSAG
jgi:hypothetical protein